MNNDAYNETIEKNGQTYRYDPDYDCYYRVCTAEDLTHWRQWGWIYVTALLCVTCYCVEFLGPLQ